MGSSPLIGIDLGTTNSLCSQFAGGAPRLIPNAHGHVLTPSIVGVLPGGEVVVGETAKELALTQPGSTVAAFKRWMGEDRATELAGQSFSPVQLSSLVLRSLKADAESALGVPVEEAVITVPAYFNEHQRRATRDAGELAGLEVRRVLNEPTAAALSFGYHQKETSQTLLVFDLGGGTFDVTLMEIFEGTLEILSTAGESRLGGEDFTDALVSWALERTGRMLETAELREPLFVARLRNEAELAKCSLGLHDSAGMRIPGPEGDVGPDAERLEITPALFETLAKPLVARLRIPVERALRDARRSFADVDEVLLVGGATRMSVVRTLISDLLGRPARHEVDPDEAVGLGAAVQAALIRDDQAVEDMVMTDVCPFTLGVEVAKLFGARRAQGFFLPVIHRNTTIPVSRQEIVSTLDANQTRITLGIYQGEGRRVEDNLKLGELKVEGIPPGPPGQEVAVRFTYDLSGLLEVEAYVPDTGARFKTLLEDNVKGLSKQELKQAAGRMRQVKFYPRDQLENRRLIHFAERIVKELEPTSRGMLEEALDAYETALDAGDREFFDGVRRELELRLSALGFPYAGEESGPGGTEP